MHYIYIDRDEMHASRLMVPRLAWHLILDYRVVSRCQDGVS